jgi:hypothetical protein
MNELFSYLIRFLLHAIIFVAIWLMIQPVLNGYFMRLGKQFDYRLRLKVKMLGNRITKLRKSFWLYKHIDSMLYLANDKYEPGISVMRFFILTGFLFLSMFIIGMLTIADIPNQISFSNPFQQGVSVSKTESGGLIWQYPFLLAILITSIPYARLRYIYSKRTVQSSYDLLEVIKIYSKFSHLSMESALMKTSQTTNIENVLRGPLKILSTIFTSYGNLAELQREIHRFTNTIGTTFALQFGSDLMYAQTQGDRSLKGNLLSLTISMEQQRETILTVKSKSRDAISMGVYGNLIVIALCIGSVTAFLKPAVYIQLQFQTKTGLTFLSVIIVSLFISFMISVVLSRPKLDYH